MKTESEVSCDVQRSFRVEQVAGMFDLPLEAKTSRRWSIETPGPDEPWRIGVIGKEQETTIGSAPPR